MTVSDLLETLCNKSDNDIKLVSACEHNLLTTCEETCYNLFEACNNLCVFTRVADSLEQAVNNL